jgi:hypothetical protein
VELSAYDSTKIGQSALRYPLFHSAVTLTEGGRMWINKTFEQKRLITCNVGLLFVMQSIPKYYFVKLTDFLKKEMRAKSNLNNIII